MLLVNELYIHGIPITVLIGYLNPLVLKTFTTMKLLAAQHKHLVKTKGLNTTFPVPFIRAGAIFLFHHSKMDVLKRPLRPSMYYKT